jgi:hypothetical protein
MPSSTPRVRALRLRRKEAAAQRLLANPLKVCPIFEKRKKVAKQVKEWRRADASNTIEREEAQRVDKLPSYGDVWKQVQAGESVAHDGNPGGSCSGVYRCKATVGGAQVEVALKVMKTLHQLVQANAHGDNDDAVFESILRNVTEVLREASLAMYFEKHAPDANILRMARTMEHPDGIVASKGAIAALFLWRSNSGMDDWKARRESERWGSGEMSVRCASSLLETLHQMHTHNCAHRDLKTSNVRVDNTGEVTVIDLGGAVHDLKNAMGEELCYRVRKDGALEEVPGHDFAVDLRLWECAPGSYMEIFHPVALPTAPSTGLQPLDRVPSPQKANFQAKRCMKAAKCSGQKLSDSKYAIQMQNTRKSKVVHMMQDSSRSVVGNTGSPCGRSPETLKASLALQNAKGTAAAKKIRTDMTQRSFAHPADCYAAGLMIVEWMTGVSVNKLVKRHGEILSKDGQPEAPGAKAGKYRDERLEEEEKLHTWIQTEIADQGDKAKIVSTLRALRHRGFKEPQGRAGKGRAAALACSRWNALAEVVKGLLHPAQRDRMTAAQAFQRLREVH